MSSERWLSRFVGVAMVAGLLGGALPVSAQQAAAQAAPAEAEASSDEQARLHFQVAAQYYQEADYESALREFQSAYRLSQRPQLLYNISLCHQQLGNLEEAVSNLERYLAEVPDVENRPLLEQRLANLTARRDRQRETGTDPGEGGQTQGDPSRAPPRAVEEPTNVPAIVGFTVAGLGLVSAAVFSILTLVEDGAVSARACATTRTCGSADTGTLGTLALISDVSWGVSLAGAIVGTIFLFVPTGGSNETVADLRFAPLLGTTTGLSLSGSF